jgi:Nucleotidyl transferase AbiEii toxin, Type IV TA system
MKLHYETVEPKTVKILEKLMQMPSLKDFYLVGGTALSLQWGHRISEDLDLFKFSNEDIDGTLILDEIEINFNSFSELGRKNYYLKLQIEGIKIDIMRYKYPLIDATLEIDGIRMLSPKDIAPMKLLAISNRGAKKDFYDLYYLFKLFSLDEMYNFYEQKFGKIDTFQIHRSLCFFDDAETERGTLVPLGAVTWEQAKQEIKRLARCI